LIKASFFRYFPAQALNCSRKHEFAYIAQIFHIEVAPDASNLYERSMVILILGAPA